MEVLSGAKLTKKELKDQQERARIAQEAINAHREANRLAEVKRAAQRALDEAAAKAENDAEIQTRIARLKEAVTGWREERSILGI